MKLSAFSRILRLFFILLAIITALKILLVGYDIDEQYAISMSCRLLRGDFPVRDMWEPHQTSGFLAAAFMAPYLALMGSTSGIVLYLRCCGLILHSLTAFLFYKQLKAILAEYALAPPRLRQDLCLLIVCIYFFSLPKLMFLPEFSNMQLWFLMLMILCMSYYYTRFSSQGKASLLWLSGAGFCLALEVLSYPSSLLLFPLCIYCVFRYHGLQAHQKSKELAAFCIPCIAGAMLFMGYLFTEISPEELAALLPLVASDGSHAASLSDRLLVNVSSLGEILFYFAIYGIIALGLKALLQSRIFSKSRWGKSLLQQKIPGRLFGSTLLLLATLLGQLLIWLFENRYPNYPLVEYFFVPALALVRMPRKTKSEKILFTLFVFLPLTAFAGIVLFTNHPLLVSAPFLGICTAGVLLCALLHVNDHFGLFRTVLAIWVFVLLFGKCYMIRTTGGTHYTLFHPVSVMREGPAAGIIADTETVRKYKDSHALLQETVPRQSKVFYIGSSNGIYLMQDMEFCTPSTISSPTFDEKVALYFSMHPEKTPEYIVCDAELAILEGDSFLPQFLRECCSLKPVAENDFLVIYQTLAP